MWLLRLNLGLQRSLHWLQLLETIHVLHIVHTYVYIYIYIYIYILLLHWLRNFAEEYVVAKIESWVTEISALATVARNYPRAAYCAYVRIYIYIYIYIYIAAALVKELC